MNMIELMGHVDEQHRLSVDLPSEIRPGPVKVLIGVPEDDDDANAWARAIGEAWLADWSDPREDIYTLEDGQPVDHGPK